MRFNLIGFDIISAFPMANRKPIEVGEWYHCYNRGVDKRRVFQNSRDYERMLGLMFLAKHSLPVRLFSIEDALFARAMESKTSKKVGAPIVEIGAYALMPNHIHFVMREIVEGGISLFMQKVFTGYTMYFNVKSNRSGALFSGTFKSIHVVDDRYMKHLISYVHMNPGELFQPGWKTSGCDVSKMEKDLRTYRYSSLQDFAGIKRIENTLIDNSIYSLYEKLPSIQSMLGDAQMFETLHSENR